MVVFMFVGETDNCAPTLGLVTIVVTGAARHDGALALGTAVSLLSGSARED
jgi:hypothetical protein